MTYVFDYRWFGESLGDLAQGMALTAGMTLIACALSTILGLALALARTSPNRFLRPLAATYIEAIRNTPLLAQAFLLYFGIGSLGVRFDPLMAAVATLVLNGGGYMAEIFRAGLDSIHRSQHEAAAAMGMTPMQSFRHVVLPQALRNVYPALSAQYVLTLLATSIMSQISAEELTATGSRISSYNFRSIEVYVVIAGLYLAMVVLFKLGLAGVGQLLFRRPTAVMRLRT